MNFTVWLVICAGCHMIRLVYEIVKLKQKRLTDKASTMVYITFVMCLFHGVLATVFVSVLIICHLLFWRAAEERIILSHYPEYADYARTTWF